MKQILSSGKSNRILRIVGLCVGTFMILLLIYSYLNYRHLRNSEAYRAAIHYLEKSEQIHTLTGGIRNFGIPTGKEVRDGEAYYFISVKGSEEDVKVKINLTLDSTGHWHVTKMNIR